MDDGEPLSDDVLHVLATRLRKKEAARAVALLLSSQPMVEREKYDNWDGGLYYVRLVVRSDASALAMMDDEEVTQITTIIGEVAAPLLAETDQETFDGVRFVPVGGAPAGWRDQTLAWLRGNEVTNQGRVRSDNVAPLTHDGLLFRSRAEIHLYNALKASGITFAPLPVFIRGGQKYRRIEPDFLVIKDGYVFQVEVDGDRYHDESPVTAQSRTAPMEYEGVKVRRFGASELRTAESAQQAVRRLLAWIEKEKNNRT